MSTLLPHVLPRSQEPAQTRACWVNKPVAVHPRPPNCTASVVVVQQRELHAIAHTGASRWRNKVGGGVVRAWVVGECDRCYVWLSEHV